MYDKSLMNTKRNKVLITGGCGFIGSHTATLLLEKGFNLVIIDSNKKEARIIQNKFKKLNKIVEFFHMDLSDHKNFNKKLKEIEAKYGLIKRWGLVHYPKTKDWNDSLEKQKETSWEKNINHHLNGTCLLASKIAKNLSEEKKGQIVLTSSIYGKVAPNFSIYKGTELTTPAAYSAIKGGISAYTKYLASFFGVNNIQINCISPGGIINNQPKIFVKNYSENTCLKRMATTKEVANVYLFLLSDLSSYITGIDLPVDGGFLAL